MQISFDLMDMVRQAFGKVCQRAFSVLFRIPQAKGDAGETASEGRRVWRLAETGKNYGRVETSLPDVLNEGPFPGRVKREMP
jgi:hypothetical protein